MYMNHQFTHVEYYLPEISIDIDITSSILNGEVSQNYTVFGSVQMDDSLLEFLLTTFQWIPSINPSFFDERRMMFGLNRLGDTLFNTVSCKIMETQVIHWIGLLQLAPDFFSPIYDNRIAIQKGKAIDTLKMLLNLIREIRNPNGYIFHFGI